ncbi:MAG TPA: hypothetical protein VKU36_02235, partial [Candidatus Babeliales bacterium]|nr:hypothetical protein [Candidatus Babeliales bacterium]
MKNRSVGLVMLSFLWLMSLRAEKRTIQEGTFDCPLNYLCNQSYDRCVYLGKKCSNLSDVVSQISN